MPALETLDLDGLTIVQLDDMDIAELNVMLIDTVDPGYVGAGANRVNLLGVF